MRIVMKKKTIKKSKNKLVWVTKSGHEIHIKNMSYLHLKNSIQMLKRNTQEYNQLKQRAWMRSFVDMFGFPGELPETPVSTLYPEYKILLKEFKQRKLLKKFAEMIQQGV
jgi:hypothetical protein